MSKLAKLISNLKLSGIDIPGHVEKAMYKVDIEDFTNYEADDFYLDRPVVFLKSQSGAIKNISAPHMIVTMLHHLEVNRGQDIVIYGAKGGYLSALLAHIVEENGSVTVIDPSMDIVTHVSRKLIGYPTVNCYHTSQIQKEMLPSLNRVLVTGQLEMSSSNSFTVVGEDGKGLFETSPGAASLDKLSGVSLLTRQTSIDALRVLDRSLDRIHKERAKLGALMSRMEKAIDNLSNVALNTDASRGRIEDADFAKESARLTKAQILQQSAMAMIAQAGKAQQNVLQLLQN